MTTAPTVPAAAVRIATDAARWLTEVPVARTVVAELDAAGWLHDPTTVNCGEGHDPARICCAHARDVKALRARLAELDAAAQRLTRALREEEWVQSGGGTTATRAALAALEAVTPGAGDNYPPYYDPAHTDALRHSYNG